MVEKDFWKKRRKSRNKEHQPKEERYNCWTKNIVAAEDLGIFFKLFVSKVVQFKTMQEIRSFIRRIQIQSYYLLYYKTLDKYMQR